MTLKVLTIDDSTTITTHLNYLLKNLKEIDWVGHAYDLEEGKKILKNTTPDVVLLDIMVSEESGFDMLNFIKKQYPKITVFMLSNLSDTIYVKKSLQLGASHFIDKSFEFESIPNLLLKEHQVKWNLN
ncbi:response regulator [uncultured Planktosalinus sp.]|uniref:response regulator n=1 Tax=uncultured Planktosalinus sp. TaxID=1810935 RepID=UPI0030DA5C1D